MFAGQVRIVSHPSCRKIFLSPEENMCSYPAGIEISIWSSSSSILCVYSKTCVKRLLSNSQEIGFPDQLLLNACQKCCILQYF